MSFPALSNLFRSNRFDWFQRALVCNHCMCVCVDRSSGEFFFSKLCLICPSLLPKTDSSLLCRCRVWPSNTLPIAVDVQWYVSLIDLLHLFSCVLYVNSLIVDTSVSSYDCIQNGFMQRVCCRTLHSQRRWAFVCLPVSLVIEHFKNLFVSSTCTWFVSSCCIVLRNMLLHIQCRIAGPPALAFVLFVFFSSARGELELFPGRRTDRLSFSVFRIFRFVFFASVFSLAPPVRSHLRVCRVESTLGNDILFATMQKRAHRSANSQEVWLPPLLWWPAFSFFKSSLLVVLRLPLFLLHSLVCFRSLVYSHWQTLAFVLIMGVFCLSKPIGLDHVKACMFECQFPL